MPRVKKSKCAHDAKVPRGKFIGVAQFRQKVTQIALSIKNKWEDDKKRNIKTS